MLGGAAYVECCFGRSDLAFWVPVLPTGIYCKDLARGVRDMLSIQKSDIYLADPVSGLPFKGTYWIMPYEPVRVWMTPLGELPVSLCSTANEFENIDLPATVDPSVEPSSPESMPFHAVRVGRKTGIFLSKSEMMAQVSGVEGAEFKTFATPTEAATYLSDGEGVGERDLMSPGSRARHPPTKSSSPCLVTVAGAPAVLSLIDILLHCVFDPAAKTAYCVLLLYPASNKSCLQVENRVIRNVKNASQSELIASCLGIQAAMTVRGFKSDRTVIRLYCSSTVATNAVNDYARNQLKFVGANAKVMQSLARLLKDCQVRAFWTSNMDPALSEAKTQAIQLRLMGSKGLLSGDEVENADGE